LNRIRHCKYNMHVLLHINNSCIHTYLYTKYIHENIILHLFFLQYYILSLLIILTTHNTLTRKVDIDVNANNKLYQCNISNNIILIEWFCSSHTFILILCHIFQSHKTDNDYFKCIERNISSRDNFRAYWYFNRFQRRDKKLYNVEDI